ncbi:MAG: hypothetical protein ACX931_11550 [Saccharospirillum sp.]
MVRQSLFIALLGLTVAVQVPAQTNERWLCTFDSNERRIELAYRQSGQSVPCEVRYQRDNEDWQTLWSANNQVGYCEEQAEGFVEQQRGWGWECELENHQATPPEPEPVSDAMQPPLTEPGTPSDSAAQSMAELARTTDFFQAYSVLTPLRLAVIEYHATKGQYPDHLSQLDYRAEQLLDNDALRALRLSTGGVIVALATTQLGEDATLRLQPVAGNDNLNYEWRCTTNVRVRHNPQCQFDEQLRYNVR